jgi:predicted transcriptional regulator
MDACDSPRHAFTLPSESETRVLSHVVRNADCTQLDIVKTTGISQQSVSRLVNDLVARGALMLGDRRSSGRRGQPGSRSASPPIMPTRWAWP